MAPKTLFHFAGSRYQSTPGGFRMYNIPFVICDYRRDSHAQTGIQSFCMLDKKNVQCIERYKEYQFVTQNTQKNTFPSVVVSEFVRFAIKTYGKRERKCKVQAAGVKGNRIHLD